MEDYKMPNFEQWLDWLDKNNMYYRTEEYKSGVRDIIIGHGDYYHESVLEFDTDGNLYYISTT